MQTGPANFYEFGAFQLDPVKRLLRRLDGTPVPLTPRVFDTLLYMVEHHDSVMDKERIMEAVWSDSIVEENNLAQAIWKLRQVFGETPGSHSYIVTVPGRGYRFVAEVNKRNGDMVSRVPLDSTTTPTSVHGPTEADPTADRDQLLPKARHGTSRSDWRIFGAAIAAIIVVGLAVLFFVRYRSLPASVRAPSSPAPADAVLSVPARIAEKSIAVLPFENRSAEKENAYFADGIEDEILTRLSNIGDLKVVSRTSTRQYQSKPANLGEIAKQLGVANILEGSVQKVADQVRVNVQLVNAQTDSHLWADTYDRKLTDIFGVESEIAKRIAESLQAKLTSREEQALAVKSTTNPEAHQLYLKGLYFSNKTLSTTANALSAQKYLREAVQLDPKFALAWALLSYVDARGYIMETLQPTVALREEARQAAETALTLHPNLGEAVLAKGGYHYFCLRDYDTAVRYFEQARQFLPNSSRIPESLAYGARRRGQWERSETYFIEAERLDPRNVFLITQHAQSYICLRRFSDALRKLDEVLNITPDDMETLATKAAIAQAQGDLPRASAALAPLSTPAADSQALPTKVYQAILERRPAPVVSGLKEILAKPDPTLGYINSGVRFWLGWAQEVSGNRADAQVTWRQARSELESFLQQQPENYSLIEILALTNAGLGDKSAALALSERAITALQIEKDSLVGPVPIESLARVAAQMGEPDRAIAALEKLLSIPYAGALLNVPLTPALLRLDPMFDPLRNDPRFQKLCEQKQP